MQNKSFEDPAALHASAVLSGEGPQALLADAGLWLTGGASLLLWTAVSLLLTTA